MSESISENDIDERWMRGAIAAAHIAEENGDVPIGCVIVCEGKIIGRGILAAV